MSDLRNRVAAVRRNMRNDASRVNWQSIAVLMFNRPEHEELIVKELNRPSGGWWSEGALGGCDTSLYLSPKGMAYWLHHAGHETLYHRIMGARQSFMNKAGWLHISAGQVNQECRITLEARRWLAHNKPHPASDRAIRNADGTVDWKIAPYPSNAEDVTAEPYSKAAPFDIRPIPDFDFHSDEHWERLEKRIRLAAGNVEVSHPCPAPKRELPDKAPAYALAYGRIDNYPGAPNSL